MPTIADIYKQMVEDEAKDPNKMPSHAMDIQAVPTQMGGSGFNPQIQDMDQQLIRLQSNVNDLTGAVNTLVGVISALQKSVQRIENQLPPVAPPAKPGDRNLLV